MRVVKQEIKGKPYYYLQHTYKVNGIVKTKRNYLGNSLPENIENLKANLYNESRKQFFTILDSIRVNFQSEWQRIPESAKKRELEEIAIAFTYNTNAIEGSTITLSETRELLQQNIAPNKPFDEVLEAQAHRAVLMELLSEKNLSKELLLQWHKQLFLHTKQDIAGTYREYLVRVGSYVAIDWQDIPKEMQALMEFIRVNKLPAVELAARAHYRFEKIHPFGDGNGRVGRLLMNSVLWHKNYPMLIIEHKKRKAYYAALNQDEERFVQYFIRTYIAAHKKRYASQTTAT